MKPNSTSFKKGQIPWSKGLTKETSELVRKIAEKRKGQKRTPEQRKRFSERLKKQYSNGWSPRKGKRHSEAAKQKMSKMKIGSNHPNFGKRLSSETRKKISEFNILNHLCSSYLRIEVKDLPGVLSSITKIFAKNKISIKNLIQKPNKKNKKASIIIITHESLEKNFQSLLSNLIKNKFVLKKPTFIRIEKV